ncbi:P-loop containing nucleoside triphosphate hydrolase protein, partial [Gonapodya prolifera JEL478]
MPVKIGVAGLSYSIEQPNTRLPRQILRNVDVTFSPGKLTGVLGVSGVGKTTLLRAIGGFLNGGNLSGDVKVNGNDLSPVELRKIVGFVFQDDLQLPTLTPREYFTQSAVLRLPETLSALEKSRRVEETLTSLQLSSVADNLVGQPPHGISGGERKRLSIGLELIINPSILLVDEPTSGLDAFSALNVMELLKNLTMKGKTVVASIHQPSSEIFNIFDDILILAEGAVVFHGPVSSVVPYFTERGFRCPEYTNPADYVFINILSPTLAPSPIPKLVDSFAKQQSHGQHHQVGNGISPGIAKEMVSFWTQYKFLYVRAFRNSLRNRLVLRARIAQILFVNLLIGITYYNLPSRPAEAQIQDRGGLLFILSVSGFMSAILNVLGTFLLERNVFERENQCGYYDVPAYFFSKVAVELPNQIWVPFVGISISYWLVG